MIGIGFSKQLRAFSFCLIPVITAFFIFGGVSYAQNTDASDAPEDRDIDPTPESRQLTALPLLVKLPGTNDDVEPSFRVEAPEFVQLGWGWSQSRGAPLPTVCIEFTAARGKAQTSHISIEEVSDNYSLSKAMDVSASVSVRAMGAPVDSKAEFAKSSKVSATSISFLVAAEVLNSAEFAAPGTAKDQELKAVRLTEWAAGIAAKDLQAFQDVCGEGYVAAMFSGARAYLLSVIETKSKLERESMRASVSGSGWGQKAEAAVGTNKQLDTASLKRNVTFFQQGGSAEAPKVETELPRDAEQAINRITKLASAAAEAGKVFEIEISPYEILENFPHGQRLLAKEEEHDQLAALWGAYTTIYDDLAVAISSPADYLVPVRNCDSATECSIFLSDMNKKGRLPMVEAIQDMTLVALAKIELMAEQCLVKEEACEVNSEEVRSPYSVLANMPIHKPTLPEENPSTQVHTDIFLRDAVMRRCNFGARTPGCISNKMINAWAARKGLLSQVLEDPDKVLKEIEQRCRANVTGGYVGDADNGDAKVLWHSPSVVFKARADGTLDFDCPPRSS